MNRARIATLGTLLLALYPATAGAIPAFARQTGMSCTACHDAWPRLNDFGENFRDRGYRTVNSNDKTWTKLLETVPFSFRATPIYQFIATTNQETDLGTRTIATGSFAVPSADIYAGGPLSNHVSTYVDVAGFGPDGAASLEPQ